MTPDYEDFIYVDSLTNVDYVLWLMKWDTWVGREKHKLKLYTRVYKYVFFNQTMCGYVPESIITTQTLTSESHIQN